MQLTLESQLKMHADPLQIYELLLKPSTLEPLSKHSIGRAFFVYQDRDPDDRAFMWKYQFAGATLTTTARLDVMKPEQELGMQLSGDITGYLRWRFFPDDDHVRVALSVDMQFPEGVIGKLTSAFVKNQIEFELALMLRNLRALVETDSRVSQPSAEVLEQES